jgi:hypothetical protein
MYVPRTNRKLYTDHLDFDEEDECQDDFGDAFETRHGKTSCIQQFSRACPSHLVASTMCICFMVLLIVIAMLFVKVYNDYSKLEKSIQYVENRLIFMEQYLNITNETFALL